MMQRIGFAAASIGIVVAMGAFIQAGLFAVLLGLLAGVVAYQTLLRFWSS